MANVLQKYFPMIRTREEVRKEITGNDRLMKVWQGWNREQQELFLDYCSGQRGVRILYDTFFKEILDPNTTPERVEELLSLILKQKVKILKVLPLESPRLGDEQSLIVMDVVVELEDHSIANLEVQKAGYYFPGQRAACYSSDLLLRQYRRVREDLEKQEKRFSYREIKKVYTIILYEKSPKEFHDFPRDYMHRFAWTLRVTTTFLSRLTISLSWSPVTRNISHMWTEQDMDCSRCQRTGSVRGSCSRGGRRPRPITGRNFFLLSMKGNMWRSRQDLRRRSTDVCQCRRIRRGSGSRDTGQSPCLRKSGGRDLQAFGMRLQRGSERIPLFRRWDVCLRVPKRWRANVQR